MTTTKDAREFYVNGHRCEIEYERREHYTGSVDGEEITSSHNPSHIREKLIEDAKWREEVEPDFWKICRAVHNFLKRQQDPHTEEYLWVYNDVVISQVTPLQDVGPAYSALLELETQGFVEQGDICMDLNVESMWRVSESDEPTEESVESLKYP